MKSILDGGQHLVCRHERVWPPAPAFMGSDALDVRSERGDDAMTRYLTWQRDCGLMSMDPSKCRSCKHIIVDGVPTTPVGTSSVAPPFMRRTRVRRS